ncbi:MAG: glycogen-binding domain-containing protein [Salinibacter sp.]
MWRLLLLIGLLIGTGTGPAGAQEWSGTAGLGLSGGHQTNLYLDPVLGTWNPDVQTFFLAVTPQLGLTRTARRTRIDLTVRGRLNPRRSDVPQLTQSTLRVRHRLGPNWALGLVGGGTRYRYPAFREAVGTARDSWWALPSLRWTPTNKTVLTLRTGLTQRFERLPTLTDRQTSGLVSLRATHWLSDRVQGGVEMHYSDGRASAAETGFGGSGGTLRATYWPTDAVSIRGAVALEQLRYETLRPPSTIRDRLARAGLTVKWTPYSALTLFGRARALTADLGAGAARTDVHVSAGLRLRARRVLGGTAAAPLRRRVCESTENGVRLRVPYEGAGTLHVTGDFNNWSLPGVPLRPAGDDTWQATLDLPAGRYAYRLRVVRNGAGRWLDLPSYAKTAEDPFGGTNGVCIVQ